MGKNTYVPTDNIPIAVYNCDVPELIAVFADKAVLIKWLGNNQIRKEVIMRSVNYAIKSGGKINKKTNGLKLSLALRNVNEKQLKLLADKEYVILVDYVPKPTFNMLKFFNESRVSLAEHALEGDKERHLHHVIRVNNINSRKGKGASYFHVNQLEISRNITKGYKK